MKKILFTILIGLLTLNIQAMEEGGKSYGTFDENVIRDSGRLHHPLETNPDLLEERHEDVEDMRRAIAEVHGKEDQEEITIENLENINVIIQSTAEQSTQVAMRTNMQYKIVHPVIMYAFYPITFALGFTAGIFVEQYAFPD